jgi:hypothetical protein
MGEDGWGYHFVSLFTRKVHFALPGTLILSSGEFLLGRNMVGATMLFLTWENPFLPERIQFEKIAQRFVFSFILSMEKKEKFEKGSNFVPLVEGEDSDH